MKSAVSGVPASYRLAVASRIVAAALGGYVLASLASICVAWLMPSSRADAVITAMMLSFLVYLVAVLWCFACRSAGRAWFGILLPIAILALVDGGLYWMHHG